MCILFRGVWWMRFSWCNVPVWPHGGSVISLLPMLGDQWTVRPVLQFWSVCYGHTYQSNNWKIFKSTYILSTVVSDNTASEAEAKLGHKSCCPLWNDKTEKSQRSQRKFSRRGCWNVFSSSFVAAVTEETSVNDRTDERQRHYLP